MLSFLSVRFCVMILLLDSESCELELPELGKFKYC